ncbi:beta-1,3-galactosyl-O-glycosyl-glycoprotein beta-1,6-N-acetylglucosaminyltransferase [Elysia marginata]|uniref:Beta-1,3-galactosyl-O-glycosyl-glycoprotein beta-1,6-N-acetylglucosaminyltransferase n=1 Tax=Elysia marginata TaxID=1093978 RepID=A0AAV4IUJ6_9GAST|nr:beta-1,3-galactosyl-O-glycosyl-glycoprotein beta-1,6-N-acetylglucosaminyltransferase [Elysia marginata]
MRNRHSEIQRNENLWELLRAIVFSNLNCKLLKCCTMACGIALLVFAWEVFLVAGSSVGKSLTELVSVQSSLQSLPTRTQTPDSSAHSQYLSEIAEKYRQPRVNCSAIFAGDEKETKRAVTIASLLAADEKPTKYNLKTLRSLTLKDKSYVDAVHTEVKKWSSEFKDLTNEWYINATKDCEQFRQTRGYIMSELTQEEAEFPIAFSLMVYKNMEMVERLLRSVYRPQNFYCIHVDAKSDPKFYEALQAVSSCLPDNVRVASRRVKVYWGQFSVLEPELVCMEDLINMDNGNTAAGYGNLTGKKQKFRGKKWKYFINLTGQEFPLKTNYELVKILKAFKGANNQEGTIKRIKQKRWTTSPPHEIIPVKGAVHTVINRATVDFILHDSKAKDFMKWLKTTIIPDETLFASINYNPRLNIPGTYNGSNLEEVEPLARYKIWKEEKRPCASGQILRQICVLSTGDLERMWSSPYLIANKFALQQDRVAIGCLEERLFNATRDEGMGWKSFNTSRYENLDFVLNQVPPPAERHHLSS